MKAKNTMTVAEYRTSGTEKDIQKGICDLLNLLKIPHSVTDAGLTKDSTGKVIGRAVTRDGWPDITACLPLCNHGDPTDTRALGQFFAIETKSRKGKLRPSQKICLAELEAAGARICIPRSIADVAEALLAIGFQHQALIALTK